MVPVSLNLSFGCFLFLALSFESSLVSPFGSATIGSGLDSSSSFLPAPCSNASVVQLQHVHSSSSHFLPSRVLLPLPTLASVAKLTLSLITRFTPPHPPLAATLQPTRGHLLPPYRAEPLPPAPAPVIIHHPFLHCYLDPCLAYLYPPS